MNARFLPQHLNFPYKSGFQHFPETRLYNLMQRLAMIEEALCLSATSAT